MNSLVPDVDDLRRNPPEEHQQIRNGQTEQVVVCSRVHVFVPGYDHTSHQVPNTSGDEYEDVDDSQWEHNVEGVMLRSPAQVIRVN